MQCIFCKKEAMKNRVICKEHDEGLDEGINLCRNLIDKFENELELREAKRENKNQEFYNSDKDYYSADNLILLSDLKAEFKNPTDKIQLYFQPQIDLNNGKILSVESLRTVADK